MTPETLKTTLESLPPDTLPLHQATTQGGVVDADSVSVTVLALDADEAVVNARVGVFFEEVVGGCNCHDDPYRANGYCELAVRIDHATGGVEARLLAD